MASDMRTVQEWLDLCAEQGFRFIRTDNGYRVLGKDGKSMVFLKRALPPSGAEEIRQKLKRLGVVFPTNRPARKVAAPQESIEVKQSHANGSTLPVFESPPLPLPPIVKEPDAQPEKPDPFAKLRQSLTMIMEFVAEAESALGEIEQQRKVERAAIDADLAKADKIREALRVLGVGQ